MKRGAEPFRRQPGDGTAVENWMLFRAPVTKPKSDIRVTIFPISVEKVSFTHKTPPLFTWGLFKLRIKTRTSAFCICT